MRLTDRMNSLIGGESRKRSNPVASAVQNAVKAKAVAPKMGMVKQAPTVGRTMKKAPSILTAKKRF